MRQSINLALATVALIGLVLIGLWLVDTATGAPDTKISAASGNTTTRVTWGGSLRYIKGDTYRARRDLIRRGWKVPRPSIITRLGRGPCARQDGGSLDGAYACATVVGTRRAISYDAASVIESSRVSVVRRKGRRVTRTVKPSCWARVSIYHELLHHVTDYERTGTNAYGGPIWRAQGWGVDDEVVNHALVDWIAEVYADQDRRRGRCLGVVDVQESPLEAFLIPADAVLYLRASDYKRREVWGPALPLVGLPVQ